MMIGKPSNPLEAERVVEPDPTSSMQLMRLADALCDMRDSWVTISLALTDLVTDTASPERDKVLTEVERYLARIREADRR
jgi:hypothetical protein